MVKDPVCGMDVDPNKTEYKFEYRGEMYYFCSHHCKEEFRRNPEKYIKSGPSEGHHAHHQARELKRRLLLSLLLTIPIFFLSPIASDLGIEFELPNSDSIQLISASLLFAYGGSFFILGAIQELRKRLPGMMTLVSLGISASFIYSLYAFLTSSSQSFYFELAMLIDIMLAGHYIEAKALASATGHTGSLIKLLPSKANLITDSGMKEVPTSMLKPGDVIIVRPGERIAADGIVEEGTSSVDESLLTGESIPVLKSAGSEVIGGSLNIEAPLKVRVRRSGEESYLAQVERMMEEIRSSKSSYVELADRAAFLLTLAIIIAGFSSFLYWLLSAKSLGFAVERLASIFVVACPHALGLATPVVIYRVTTLTSRRGILLKSKGALEKARGAKVVMFDKTGTLTTGKFAVKSVRAFDGFSEEEVLSLASSVEALSNHPIAKALVERANSSGLRLSEVENFRNIPGYGVEGIVDGKRVVIANPNYFNVRLEVAEGSSVLVEVDGRMAGSIELEDTLKEEAALTVRKLKEMGYEVYMLTGDRRAAAERISNKLGLDGFFSELKPHEKVEVIRKLQEEGKSVIMVGDGVNDAPALMQADLGVAIGAGTDIAMESADIILVRNNLEDVIYALKISKSAYRKMVENVLWTIGYNSLTVPLAAGMLSPAFSIGPAVGAALMSVSDVLVVLNATLLH